MLAAAVGERDVFTKHLLVGHYIVTTSNREIKLFVGGMSVGVLILGHQHNRGKPLTEAEAEKGWWWTLLAG